MAATIPQIDVSAKQPPQKGEPFNFPSLPDSVLIPRVIAADSTLLPGARLLWGVIRQFAPRDGKCCASDETLAAAVGVKWRQVVRYCRNLERAGLLRTTARPGKTPVRELLRDSRFEVARKKGVSSETGGAVMQGRGGCLPGQAHIRNNGVLSGSLIGKASDGIKMPSQKPAVPPAEKPAGEWTEEDYIARGRAMGFPEHVIQRDVERVRARKADPQKGRLTKASELAKDLEAAIGR